jgi:hypothetical protein
VWLKFNRITEHTTLRIQQTSRLSGILHPPTVAPRQFALATPAPETVSETPRAEHSCCGRNVPC